MIFKPMLMNVSVFR